MNAAKKTLMALAVLAAPLAAQATSFDCAKAATDAERLICTDAGLSRADDNYAAVYRTALAESTDQPAFRAHARYALTQRELCHDAACLHAWYASRIADMIMASPSMGGTADAPAHAQAAPKAPAAPFVSQWKVTPSGEGYVLSAKEPDATFAIVATANDEDNGLAIHFVYRNAPRCAGVGPRGVRGFATTFAVKMNDYIPTLSGACLGPDLVAMPIYPADTAKILSFVRSGSVTIGDLKGDKVFHYDTRGIDAITTALVSPTP
jgi:uncharacterized protein